MIFHFQPFVLSLLICGDPQLAEFILLWFFLVLEGCINIRKWLKFRRKFVGSRAGSGSFKTPNEKCAALVVCKDSLKMG